MPPLTTTTVNPGAGGAAIVTDQQAAGSQMPVSELTFAPDNVSDAARVTPANPLPVTDYDSAAVLGEITEQLREFMDLVRDLADNVPRVRDALGYKHPLASDALGQARASLYDGAGNIASPTNKSTIPTTGQGVVSIAGTDGYNTVRAARYDRFGTQRTTSDVLLFCDLLGGGSISANPVWQSTVAGGPSNTFGANIVINANASPNANASTGILTQRQYPVYPQAQLRSHFRIHVEWPDENTPLHSTVEIGFSSATGNTAFSQGAIFQFNPLDGSVYAILSNGGYSQSVKLLTWHQATNLNACDYDIVLGDAYARFIICDSTGIPVVDTTITTVPNAFIETLVGTNMIPTGVRLYNDAVGPVVGMRVLIGEHAVWLSDMAMGMPWTDQTALCTRQAGIQPVSFAATSQAFGAAPATLTPANGTTGFATFGGEYRFATVVAAETPAALFSFQIPTPFTFLLQGLAIPAPIVSTTIATTGIAFIEWMIMSNASTNLLSTANGFIQGAGGTHAAPSAAAAQGSMWSGGLINWAPRTPILCLPNTWLHIGFKILGATAVTTPGAHRGTVTVDGYFV